MESKNKELLLQKVDELVCLIQNDEDYKKYFELQEKMKKNEEIMSLINKIKKEEQTLVKKEYKKEDITLENKKILEMKTELESFPIYLEYTYLKEDINNKLQNIKSIIENSINNIIS